MNDHKNINWRSVTSFTGFFTIIIGLFTTLLITAFFLFQHLSSRASFLTRPAKKITLLFFLFIGLFFISTAVINGVMAYRRHKHLTAAIITTALSFCLGGSLVFIISIVLSILMTSYFNENYPLKTD